MVLSCVFTPIFETDFHVNIMIIESSEPSFRGGSAREAPKNSSLGIELGPVRKPLHGGNGDEIEAVFARDGLSLQRCAHLSIPTLNSPLFSYFLRRVLTNPC